MSEKAVGSRKFSEESGLTVSEVRVALLNDFLKLQVKYWKDASWDADPVEGFEELTVEDMGLAESFVSPEDNLGFGPGMILLPIADADYPILPIGRNYVQAVHPATRKDEEIAYWGVKDSSSAGVKIIFPQEIQDARLIISNTRKECGLQVRLEDSKIYVLFPSLRIEPSKPTYTWVAKVEVVGPDGSTKDGGQGLAKRGKSKVIPIPFTRKGAVVRGQIISLD